MEAGRFSGNVLGSRESKKALNKGLIRQQYSFPTEGERPGQVDWKEGC